MLANTKLRSLADGINFFSRLFVPLALFGLFKKLRPNPIQMYVLETQHLGTSTLSLV